MAREGADQLVVACPEMNRQIAKTRRSPETLAELAPWRLVRWVSAFAVLALAACSTTPASPPDPATQIVALEGRIYELVNDERRAEGGANDLALDSELVKIAREKSADMAAKDAFTGTAERQASATRLMAADAAFQGLLGENVAAERYTKARGVDVEVYAKAIVGSWLQSKSHKDNLGYAQYARTGVGVALSDDTIFVTQLFATRSQNSEGRSQRSRRAVAVP